MDAFYWSGDKVLKDKMGVESIERMIAVSLTLDIFSVILYYIQRERERERESLSFD